MPEASADKPNSHYKDEIRCLISERNGLASSSLPCAGVKKQRIYFGKQIHRLIKERLATEKPCKIKVALAEFRDLKRSSSLIALTKSKGMTQIQAKNGTIKHDKDHNPEVFACFYKNLCQCQQEARDACTYRRVGDALVQRSLGSLRRRT